MDALNVCKEEKFNKQCFRKLSLTYHPDKKGGRDKDFVALAACEKKNELQRRKEPPPRKQNAAEAAWGIFFGTGAVFTLAGAAPIAFPVAGMTAAVTYLDLSLRNEE